MNTKERLIRLLPYYMENGENINNYYEILAFFYDELVDVFKEIIDSRDINKSSLYGLDIIGDIVGQKRNFKTIDDEKYRNRLKIRVMQNNSMGYIEDLNNLAESFLEEAFVKIQQGYCNEELKNEPAMLRILLNGNSITAKILKYSGRYYKTGEKRVNEKSLNKKEQDGTQINYKPIFLPDFSTACAIGTRIEYKINNKPTKIKVDTPVHFKFEPRNIKIKELEPIIHENALLQCGTHSVSAKMGVLL